MTHIARVCILVVKQAARGDRKQEDNKERITECLSYIQIGIQFTLNNRQKSHCLISQADDASVFLLVLLGALGGLEGVEVPGYAQPEHTAVVLAVVG